MSPSPEAESGPRLLLEEDTEARSWSPFAPVRPVSELLFGTLLLRERIERAAGVHAEAIVGAPELSGFTEPGTPPVLETSELPGNGTSSGPVLVLSSRWVPDLESAASGEVADPDPEATSTPEDTPRDDAPPLSDAPSARVLEEALALCREHGRPIRLALGPEAPWHVGWCLPPGHPIPRKAPPDAPLLDPGGGLLGTPWALMAGNADRVARDLLDVGLPGPTPPLEVPEGVLVLGAFPITADPGVRIEPGAVLDARSGPIHLAAGVRIDPFTHLAGPAFIGEGSHLLGGRIEAVSTGPVCKLRGEIADAVFLGYVNKAHDGYLGHAVVGRWVNLGAGTTNSDLKNNYGPVRAPVSATELEDTGLLKAGVLLGDHVKTAIGTLLNTGTVVGAGSNVFGGVLPPAWVPPFSWGAAGQDVHRLEGFLETARRAMERRGVELPPGTAAVLERAWLLEHGGDGRPSGP